MDTPQNWTIVASRMEIEDQKMVEVAVGRQLVLLIARDNKVIAVQGLCPHQMARLSGGTLNGDELQCPQHLARFNLSDGQCTGGWQLAPLRRYKVSVKDDDVMLSNPLELLD